MAARATALLLLLLFSGCGVLHPGIPGSGVSFSEFREVAPFDEVRLAGFGTVNIHVGESPSVCVTTDDNVVAHVETSVQQGRLTISQRQNIRPKTGLVIDVTVPQLTAVRVSGRRGHEHQQCCGRVPGDVR